eukprot:CFRG0298T1
MNGTGSNGTCPPKRKFSEISDAKLVVRLNVGGTLFETYLGTLSRFPSATLADFVKAKKAKLTEIAKKEGRTTVPPVFMDRNPIVFGVVIDYLRSGKLMIPPLVCNEQVELELKHWNLHNNLANSLPNDILNRIFTFLPFDYKIFVLTRVCHSWRRVVLAEKPDVLVTYTSDNEPMASKDEVPDKRGDVKSATDAIPPSTSTTSDTPSPAERLQNTTHKPNVLNIDTPVATASGMRVAVHGTESNLNAFCRREKMEKVLASFWSSHDFTFNAHISSMTGAVHKLVAVNIRNSDLDEEYFSPVAALTGLRVLTLTSCPKLSPKFLVSLKSTATLRSLDIEGCSLLNGDSDNETSFEYLPMFTDLQSLSWRDGRQDSTSTTAFFNAIRANTNLKRLYVETPLNLDSDDNSLMLLCQNLTKLEDVEFDTEEFEPAVLSALQLLPNLKRLQCDIFCDKDTLLEDALINALSNLPSLERFGTVHHCSESFWERFPHMPNLKTIATYTYHPTKSHLQALVNTIVKRLSHLEVLRIVLENTHKVEDVDEKITSGVLLKVFGPLNILKQIDLTGYHIVSDLQAYPREQIRQNLVKTLPNTKITAVGSCTDSLFNEDDW